jgi:toxin-antitoxin system PIN domain toxin
VILVDANLLLYAYDTTSENHATARAWWERSLSDTQLVRLAWITVVAFVRITTHPRVFREPMTITEASEHVGSWLERPMVGLLDPGERHWSILSNLLREARATANLVTDAHLAALAIEHGATLCSTDRDFRRFPGLSWENPLAQLR